MRWQLKDQDATACDDPEELAQVAERRVRFDVLQHDVGIHERERASREAGMPPQSFFSNSLVAGDSM